MSRNDSRRTASRLLLVAVVLVALALAACGSGGGAAGRPAPAGGGPDGDWVLTAGTDRAGALALVDGSPVTLTVRGAGVSGRAACNAYSGDVRGSGSAFRPGRIAMTEMACADPAVSALERRYLDAFAAVTTAGATSDRLVLTGDGVELTFGRQAPVADAPLEGTRWALDTIFAGDTASTVEGRPFLRLDGDGGLTGNGGCRNLAGGYRVDGDTLTVTDLRHTDDAGPGCARGPGAQDDAVLAFLAGPGATAAVHGGRLTLMRGGTGFGFTAAT